MTLTPDDLRQIEDIVAAKLDIMSAFRELPEAAREEIARDLDGYLYSRAPALRKPENTYTPRWTQDMADVNADENSVGKGHSGPTLPRWFDHVGGSSWLDSDDPQIVHFAGGGGADCMFDYLVSRCFATLAGFTEGQVFTALSGCTFKGFSTPALCMTQVGTDMIAAGSGTNYTVFICGGTYTGNPTISTGTTSVGSLRVCGAGIEQTIIDGNFTIDMLNSTGEYVILEHFSVTGDLNTSTDSSVGDRQRYEHIKTATLTFGADADDVKVSHCIVTGTTTIGANSSNMYFVDCEVAGFLNSGNLNDFHFLGGKVTGQMTLQQIDICTIDTKFTAASSVAYHFKMTGSGCKGLTLKGYFTELTGASAAKNYVEFDQGATDLVDLVIDITCEVPPSTANEVHYVNNIDPDPIHNAFVRVREGSTAADATLVGMTGAYSTIHGPWKDSVFDLHPRAKVDLASFTGVNTINGMQYFAGTPVHGATEGQQCWDSTNAILYVNTSTTYGTTWAVLGVSGGGAAAPVGEAYVTIGNTANLTAERALTAGTGIAITDAGANSTVTVAAMRTATVYVASADATAAEIAAADYACDNTADNVQIQSALDVLNGTGGGTLVLSSGTFTVAGNSLTLYNNIRIVGQGRYATTVKLANSQNNCIITDTTALSNISIENITWDGNKANQTDGANRNVHPILNLGAKTNLIIKDCAFGNCYAGAAIRLISACTHVLITNCFFTGNGKATPTAGFECDNIYNGSCIDVMVRDCVMLSCTDTGVATDNGTFVTIQGNYIDGAAASQCISIAPTASGNSNYVTITNNILYDSVVGSATKGVNISDFGSTNSVLRVIIANNQFISTNSGIYMSKTAGGTIDSILIANNHMECGASGTCIDIAGVSDDVEIVGNKMNIGSVGINFTAGHTATNYLILSNDLTNVTTDIAGTPPSGTIIVGNKGYGTHDFSTEAVKANTYQSIVATGTAPLTVASTTKVTNLNADLLDDQTGTYYLDSANFTGTNWTDLTDGGASTLHSHAGGSGHTIRENGTDQTGRTGLNFVDAAAGAGLITDDAGGDETEVNLSLYVLKANADYVDLTDGGATTLHSHAGGGSVATDAIWDAAGDLAVGTGADTAARLAISVPAANIVNVPAVINGETTLSYKSLMDATAPTTQAFGDAAAAGTGVMLARVTHKHAMPADPVTAHESTYAHGDIAGHIADAADAHDASAISIADAGGDFTATTVEGALDELQADAEALAASLRSIMLLAGAPLYPTSSAGCSLPTRVEYGASNKLNDWVLDFDTTTEENAFARVILPANYVSETFTAIVQWTAAVGTAAQTVQWKVALVAPADNSALDVAYGTAQVISDALQTANYMHISGATPAITCGGSPGPGKVMYVRITRDVANDNLSGDVRLISVKLAF